MLVDVDRGKAEAIALARDLETLAKSDEGETDNDAAVNEAFFQDANDDDDEE
jgi:hypothetical protein